LRLSAGRPDVNFTRELQPKQIFTPAVAYPSACPGESREQPGSPACPPKRRLVLRSFEGAQEEAA
jgi:hypothetical protein